MELDRLSLGRHTSRQVSDGRTSESELNENSGNSPCKESQQTNWCLIWATGGVSFLCALEGTVTGMSEWPYMNTIDSAATTQFYGMTSSFYTLGHAIFAIVFSIIYYNYHNVRFPLIIGRLIALIGCVAYLCVELLPSNRRYLMMSCYFIFGIATSTSAVLRMYVIEISNSDDRARAIAIVTVAELLSLIAGPVIQLCFAAISYPGIEIFYQMRFHIFSAPIWFAACINLFSIAFIATLMRPVGKKRRRSKKGSERMFLNIDNLRQKICKLRKSDACWPLIFLCILMRFLQIPTDSLYTIMSPILMMVFDWGREKTVVYSSISWGIVGVISFGVAAAMMTSTFGRIPQRWMYLVSLSLPLFLYIISYPYSSISHIIPAYNETSGTGCNSDEYSWCYGAKATSPYLFLPLLIVILSLVIPLCSISLDTVYSKLFGSIDQTVMQGAMVAIGDVVGIIAPIYSTFIFTLWGMETLWITNGLLTSLAAIVWILGFTKLREHD